MSSSGAASAGAASAVRARLEKMGRRASIADAAQQSLAQVDVVDHGGGVVMEATANFFRMGPAAKHVRRALTDKLSAGITHSHRRANLLLRLYRMIEEEGCDECERANAKEHDGLFGELPGWV